MFQTSILQIGFFWLKLLLEVDFFKIFTLKANFHSKSTEMDKKYIVIQFGSHTSSFWEAFGPLNILFNEVIFFPISSLQRIIQFFWKPFSIYSDKCHAFHVLLFQTFYAKLYPLSTPPKQAGLSPLWKERPAPLPNPTLMAHRV